jgi:hypothetical protein
MAKDSADARAIWGRPALIGVGKTRALQLSSCVRKGRKNRSINSAMWLGAVL